MKIFKMEVFDSRVMSDYIGSI